MKSKKELKEIIRDLVKEEIKKLLSEGIDIKDNTVAFNPSHQDNVDTNDPWNPKPIYNEVDGYRVISVFKRKMTDDKQDGNPLIYALKGKQWKFKHPQYDIMALLRRFVAVTKELNEKFDLIITTPSSNPLNNEILKRVVRILPHESYYENFFNKYTANEVYEEFIDSEWLNNTYQDEKLRNKMHSDIYKAICRMNLPKEQNGNDGVFSYKFLKPVELRNAILQSMYINEEFANEITFGEKINGKKVLVIDSDLVNHNVHKSFGVHIDNGLVEYCFEDKTFDKVIKPTSSNGLEVITAGKGKASTTAILSSNRFDELLTVAKAKYDFIFIDTSAVTSSPDYIQVSKKVDATLLVANKQKKNINLVVETINELADYNANVIGTVITC